jgi:hypothetical protein
VQYRGELPSQVMDVLDARVGTKAAGWWKESDGQRRR